MKQLRGKTLMSLLYAVILSIPLISILSRVIYVQSNKNAYQSYSGTNQNTETIVSLNTLNDFDYSKTYYLNNSALDTNITASSTNQYYCTLLEIMNNGGNLDLSNMNRFYIYVNNTNTYVNFYNNDTLIGNYANSVSFKLKILITGFSGNETSMQVSNNVLENSNIIYSIDYFTEQQLDNVFDYSVSKLVDENNFGELNFFEWFSSWLLTDSQNNMLYVRFANWYLNYALLVSLMQIIFLCLMWFVNFSRRLLERGMNYDW